MKKVKEIIFSILISIIFLSGSASAQLAEQKKISIDQIVSNTKKNLSSTKKRFVLKSKVKGGGYVSEKFSYVMHEKIVKALRVVIQDGTVTSEQEFYYSEGNLIYATESETAVKDGEIIHEWSGIYYFDGGDLFDYSTNGHGKSEDDNWQPEKEIPQLSRKRLKQLSKLLKNKEQL